MDSLNYLHRVYVLLAALLASIGLHLIIGITLLSSTAVDSSKLSVKKGSSIAVQFEKNSSGSKAVRRGSVKKNRPLGKLAKNTNKNKKNTKSNHTKNSAGAILGSGELGLEPVYPLLSIQNEEEGRVLIKVEKIAKPKRLRFTVVRNNGHNRLSQAALFALNKIDQNKLLDQNFPFLIEFDFKLTN